MILGEVPSRLEGKYDNLKDNISSTMPWDIYASPPPFHKLRRGGTKEHDRQQCHHSENSSTSHLGYGGIRGGDESLNGVKGTLSGSIVNPQYPVPTGVEKSAHNQSVGSSHFKVSPGAETGVFKMIPLLDLTHTNSNFISANDRGGSTRTPGIRSSTGRLNGGVIREGQASNAALAGGKEPALHSHGGLTTATFLKLVTILGALFSAILVWLQYDTAIGRLCPNGINHSCLDHPVSMTLLTIAKMCAGALFPSIIVTIISKCYATRHFLNNSWLSLVINFEPTHKLHTYFGVVITICSVVHGLAHITRLAFERKPELLYVDAINRSGVAALVLLLPTTLPMVMKFLKSKWTFELRKLIHLAFIPFVIALCFHGIILFSLGAILLIWYLVDRFYFTTRMTFLIDRPDYKIVGRGTLVRFNLPE